MVKLADTQDLGSCAQACGFKSHYPYHTQKALSVSRALFLCFSIILHAIHFIELNKVFSMIFYRLSDILMVFPQFFARFVCASDASLV